MSEQRRNRLDNLQKSNTKKDFERANAIMQAAIKEIHFLRSSLMCIVEDAGGSITIDLEKARKLTQKTELLVTKTTKGQPAEQPAERSTMTLRLHTPLIEVAKEMPTNAPNGKH